MLPGWAGTFSGRFCLKNETVGALFPAISDFSDCDVFLFEQVMAMEVVSEVGFFTVNDLEGTLLLAGIRAVHGPGR